MVARRNPDVRLRELERLAAQGDLDAGAQLLQERIRAGRVSIKNVELAAALGHPVALRVAEPAEWGEGGTVRQVALSGGLGELTLVLFAADAAEHVIHFADDSVAHRYVRTDIESVSRRAIAAARAWARDPGDYAAGDTYRASDDAFDAGARAAAAGAPYGGNVAYAAAYAARAASDAHYSVVAADAVVADDAAEAAIYAARGCRCC